MRRILYLVLLAGFNTYGQADSAKISYDSVTALSEVLIKGFETQRRLLETPAAVSLISSRDLQRFSNISLVPAVNTVPGVRMEERSPGSYRLSMRGSLLRSPFGVRNIKIYWNDLPLTDAGGNSYLNLIDFNAVGSIELIKGPAGSIYGAGTGGVVILQPHIQKKPEDTGKGPQEFRLQLIGGSFGTFSENFRWQSGTKKVLWQFVQTHFQSDGYRDNSKMRRETLQANVTALTGKKNKIDGLVMLTDLAYRTPGGLNLAQMTANPRQSRPATATLPSARDQKAAIYNRTAFLGATNTYTFSSKWANITSLIFAFTDFKNPFITNYEKRMESSGGIRTKFAYTSHWGNVGVKWITGMEWQKTFSTIDSSGNNKGVQDSFVVSDKVNAAQQFYFTQLETELTRDLMLQAGISVNIFDYSIRRQTGNPKPPATDINFDAKVLPRFALLYKITPHFATHLSVSKGYSPPSIAEVKPSAGGVFTGLQAEHGWNYELGIKGNVLHNRIRFDLSVFQFRLSDAIVRRVDSTGAEYFINAGGTNQKGFEGFAEWYAILNPSKKAIQQLRIWTSFTLFDFKFTDYTVASTDFSGKNITGVPDKVFLIGADIGFLGNFYLNTTFNYTSRLPLNDANAVYASQYRLLQSRLGWRIPMRKMALEIFTGVDNALNQKYSLGNDINAFGSRFYNPAPVRNYFGGVNWRF
jgi:iron complex outermembrane recepter protein